MLIDATTRELIALALREDLGPGDVTSVIIPLGLDGSARLVAKEELVLAGLDAVVEVYRQVDPEVAVRFDRPEGTKCEAGAQLGEVSGRARSLLIGERLALNLLQRMCGIATFARRCADAVVGTQARVVDTRKTTPGLRRLEKHAVRMGGCANHRFGLFDGVLIKDNHIAALGGVTAAIAEARADAHHLLRIECEVTNLDELEEALDAGADVILLDNMGLPDMEEAVRRTAGRAVLEASGNMTLERLPLVANTGVDFISMGALTHTVRAADISLQWR
jgi:nicotinate-nucleotide pyrophosphorylase (carboxylating)